MSEPDGTDIEAATFEEAVRRIVTATAPGEVMTYGEVALEAGRPGAARAVGTILRRTGADLPWWRIVNAAGRLAPHKEADQTARLRAEGVTVVDGRVPGMGRR